MARRGGALYRALALPSRLPTRAGVSADVVETAPRQSSAESGPDAPPPSPRHMPPAASAEPTQLAAGTEEVPISAAVTNDSPEAAPAPSQAAVLPELKPPSTSKSDAEETREYPNGDAVMAAEQLAHPVAEASVAPAIVRTRTTQIPAPTRVESKAHPEMTKRLNARSDLRVPEPLPPGKVPRVEFVSLDKTLSTLPKRTPAAARETSGRDAPPHRSAAGAQPQRASAAAYREEATVRSSSTAGATSNPSAAASVVEVSGAVEQPPKRREVSPISPSASTAAREEPWPRVAKRSEPENLVSVKRVDIQIVNEEPRKPTRRPRRTAASEEDITARLGRHYVREVV